MVRCWVNLVGMTPLLLGMMVAGPQIGVSSLVLAQTSQSSQQTEAQRLYQEGERLRLRGNRGSFQQALAKFQQALPLFRAAGDRDGEADNLDSIGLVYSNIEQPQLALDFFQQALTLWREVGNRRGEAITLSNIAEVYLNIRQPQQALNFYQQALTIFGELGDRTEEAAMLANIREVHRRSRQPQATRVPQGSEAIAQAEQLYNEGEQLYQQETRESLRQALAKFEEAAYLFRAGGDRNREASSFESLGRVYFSLGQPSIRRASDDYIERRRQTSGSYSRALEIYREIGDRRGEASVLNRIGEVENISSGPYIALNYHQQSLAISREIGDRSGEFTTLNIIASVSLRGFPPPEALSYYQQALALTRAGSSSTEEKLRQRSAEATTLNTIGEVYSSSGQLQEALNYYQQALPIRREVGDRSGEATTLHNIGRVYGNIGQPQEALNYYQQALPIRKEVGDRVGEAATLNNIGEVYSSIGQPQEALNYYQQALPIRKEVGDRVGEAATLSNIGLVYRNLGQLQQALTFLQQALQMQRTISRDAPDRPSGETITLNNVGDLYRGLGQSQRALEFYYEAMGSAWVSSDPIIQANTAHNIALALQSLKNIPKALEFSEMATSLVEDIRGQLINPDSRTSYFATVQGYYKLRIDLLMELHQQNPNQSYAAQAFNVTERSKARTLLEILTESRADIRTGVDPQLLRQEQAIQSQLAAIEQRLLVNLRANNTEQTLSITNQRSTLQTQYKNLQSQIRQTSPKYAALKYPQPLTLEQIQQQILDDNTLIASYSLGKDKSYLWLISKTEMTSYELPNQKIIEDLINNKVRPQITSRSRDRNTLVIETSELSNLLLKPILEKIGNKRLVIISDGALQFIPFGALPDPRVDDKYQPLLINNEVHYLPSATTLQTIRTETQNRPPAPRSIALIADPVFQANDPRVRNGVAAPSNNELPLAAQNLAAATREARGEDWNRLPNTRLEAETILKLFPSDRSLSFLDFNANRTNAQSEQLSQYRFIHWATHGFANPKNPELSGVIMSLVQENGQPQDGYLLLGDIFNLSFNADLVVLSACQTGLGEVVQGEGLIGLTRGLMYAGTSRVVTSLWSVEDKETAILMGKFYEKMLQQNLPPGEALRAAQIEMFRTPGNWAPYYWAAFTLQGEWR